MFFDLFAGGGILFQLRGTYSKQRPRAVFVLTPGKIPTVDLYLRGRIESQFGISVCYINVLTTEPDALTLDDGTLVIVVRHAPLRWLRWLERHRSKLTGVVYLMDDDIPSALTAPELPFRYTLKTVWRYVRTRRMLGRLCSEVWVSTSELMKRYAAANPKLCEPKYVPAVSSGVAEQCELTYFYHGSWAHRDEMTWLVPIISAVQKAVPDAWFEIIGTKKVQHLFRGIPRVRVVPPMSWPDYLVYAGSVRYQVGLAPCFDTPFNRARSHSKLFDITRIGAAGIYSDNLPYSEKIIPDQTGILSANDQDAWIVVIISLLRDKRRRENLHRQALDWCKRRSDDLNVSADYVNRS